MKNISQSLSVSLVSSKYTKLAFCNNHSNVNILEIAANQINLMKIKILEGYSELNLMLQVTLICSQTIDFSCSKFVNLSNQQSVFKNGT